MTKRNADAQNTHKQNPLGVIKEALEFYEDFEKNAPEEWDQQYGELEGGCVWAHDEGEKARQALQTLSTYLPLITEVVEASQTYCAGLDKEDLNYGDPREWTMRDAVDALTQAGWPGGSPPPAGGE